MDSFDGENANRVGVMGERGAWPTDGARRVSMRSLCLAPSSDNVGIDGEGAGERMEGIGDTGEASNAKSSSTVSNSSSSTCPTGGEPGGERRPDFSALAWIWPGKER